MKNKFFLLPLLFIAIGCASRSHTHGPSTSSETGNYANGQPRHVLAILTEAEEAGHHPVAQDPEFLVLNSMNGDSVQWYAAGDTFTIDLGTHPFTHSGRFLTVAEGTYSPVLRFANPGQSTGMDDLPNYDVWKGQVSDRPTASGGTMTSHPKVKFDP